MATFLSLAEQQNLETMYQDFCKETKTVENKHFIEGVLRNESGNIELVWEPSQYFCVVQYLGQFNYIVALYVAPPFRRQGWATKLLRMFDYPKICKVHPENKVIIDILENEGFDSYAIDTSPEKWYYAGNGAYCSVGYYIINAIVTIQKDNLDA